MTPLRSSDYLRITDSVDCASKEDQAFLSLAAIKLIASIVEYDHDARQEGIFFKTDPIMMGIRYFMALKETEYPALKRYKDKHPALIRQLIKVDTIDTINQLMQFIDQLVQIARSF